MKLAPYIGDGNAETFIMVESPFKFETSPVYRGRKLEILELKLNGNSNRLKLAPYIGDGNGSRSSISLDRE